MEPLEPTKKNIIVKANELVEARYRLNTAEQKLVIAMVSCIKPDDEDFKTYGFQIRELADFMGIRHKDMYTEIYEIANRLRKKDLNIYDPSSCSIVNMGWLSSAEYFVGTGYVELSFDPKLKPYLLQLKQKFVKYNAELIKKINSGYSIRIYELLKQYEKVGKRLFAIDDLRKILGIPKEQYRRYFDLRKRVLESAKQDVNEYTDIEMNYKEIRKGKKVESIAFHIIPKDIKLQNDNINSDEDISDVKILREPQTTLHKLMNYLLLSQKQAREILTMHPEDCILQQIENICNDFGVKNIRNKGAYAYKALTDGYKYGHSQYDVERAEREAQQAAEKIEAQKAKEESQEALARRIQLVENQLSKNEKIELFKEFEAKAINNPITRRSYQQRGLDSPIIRALWEKFLAGKYHLQADLVGHGGEP